MNILDTATAENATKLIDLTAWRLAALANGYLVMLTRDKATPLHDAWQTLEPTPEMIIKWGRSRKGGSSGVIITPPLIAFDGDIYQKEMSDLAFEEIMNGAPDLNDERNPLLIRNSVGHKFTILARIEGDFDSMSSRAWLPPETDLEKVAAMPPTERKAFMKQNKCQLEIFGGTRKRYIGVIGTHSFEADGNTVAAKYSWVDASPANTPIDKLPLVTKQQLYAICDAVDRLFEKRGWVKLTHASQRGDTGNHKPGNDPHAGIELLSAAMAVIPNDNVSWDEWNKVGMALWRASEGSGEGFQLFDEWSKKAVGKYDYACCAERWEGFANSPPSEIGAGTIFYMASEANPNWREGLDRGDGDRPLITVRAGILHTLATQAETALIDAGAPLYVHGERIKRPVVDEVDASKGRKTKVARFAEATTDTLKDHMSRVANFQKWDARKKTYVPTDPSHDLAATILSRDGEWRLPRVAGVITTPTLRPDGTILSEPGYDPATRLILIDPPTLPAISERPSRSDALRALSTLDGLLTEFPFADDASRSVALSGLITPVVRGALVVAPLHVVNAPEAGSGKSYIVDLASAIATGQRCPVIAAGRTEEETEKRLGSALMKGQALISIDNLNGELYGDALCQFIERPVNEVRVLGQSKNVRIESRSTMFATGNNIKIVGDIVRRSITCSLDPNMERPELRQFKADPFEMVLADRGHYVAAALTIVRAYSVAGCPATLPALASFGDWSRLVRSAIVWLGRTDPVDTMEAARVDDPKKTQVRQVVAAWRDALQGEAARPDPTALGKPLATAGLKELAEKKGTIGGFKLDNPGLHAALLEVAGVPGRGEIDTRELGKWLGKQSGRVVDGLKITSVRDTHAKQNLWCLAEVGGG
ncbi:MULTISPECIES: PriCT-2 domain-containing protein [unclassified Mesorhizobium]|uniref:PriCT-2 domain-containing protein n=1 Tax=unclassified Mesorhizobium TaxID=325217 RepID=UPI0033378CD8